MGVFVANRGEIAVRIVRAAREAGLEAVVAVTRAEADGLAARLASGVHVLPGEGPAAYLDAAALVAGAREHGCTLLHPGYGFLSESPELARACADADVTFVGPIDGIEERRVNGAIYRFPRVAADIVYLWPQAEVRPTRAAPWPWWGYWGF